MLKRFVVIGDDTFALSYHERTGMIYLVTPRRNERKLLNFLEYIPPRHFMAQDWGEVHGKNFRTEIKDHGGVPFIMRRAGQHSKLIYKTFSTDVLRGLIELDGQGYSVVETDSISSYRR